MHVIAKSLVMQTRAATEGRPYTGSDVGAGLRARPISPNNRLFRQPPEGRPHSHVLRPRNPFPTPGSTSSEYGCNSEVLDRSASRGLRRGGPPWPPGFAVLTICRFQTSCCQSSTPSQKLLTHLLWRTSFDSETVIKHGQRHLVVALWIDVLFVRTLIHRNLIGELGARINTGSLFGQR